MVVSVSSLLPTVSVTKGESCIFFVPIDEGDDKVNPFFPRGHRLIVSLDVVQHEFLDVFSFHSSERRRRGYTRTT